MLLDAPRLVTVAVLSSLVWRQVQHTRAVNDTMREAAAEVAYQKSVIFRGGEQ